MSAPNSNILALFHDGHYLADIAGGIRAAHQDGRKADFVNGSSEAEKLQTAYLHDDMTELRQKVVDALQSRGAPDGGAPLKDGDKDWDRGCQVCGQKPTVHPTQLCGPCCFGEAETAGGNW